MVGNTLSRKLTILRRKSPRSRSKIPSGTFYPTQRVFQQRSRLMPLLYSIPFSKDYLQHGFNKSGMPRPHVQCTQTALASLQLASAAGRAETCHRFDTVFVFYCFLFVVCFFFCFLSCCFFSFFLFLFHYLFSSSLFVITGICCYCTLVCCAADPPEDFPVELVGQSTVMPWNESDSGGFCQYLFCSTSYF